MDTTGLPTRRSCRRRRKTTVPLITEPATGSHGVFQFGATLGRSRPRQRGQVGTVRRDPMAMLPFSLQRRRLLPALINIGKNADESKMPKVVLRQLVPPR